MAVIKVVLVLVEKRVKYKVELVKVVDPVFVSFGIDVVVFAVLLEVVVEFIGQVR